MTFVPTGETYTDSRGWLWTEEYYGERQRSTHWKLTSIDDVLCYGHGLHIWVSFDWMGDDKWHVGAGGSPRLDALYDSPHDAIEGAEAVAQEMATFHVERAQAKLTEAERYARLVVGLRA